MKKTNQKLFIVIVVALLMAAGFYYRIFGLNSNYSFWSDEASTARFGRGVVCFGLPRAGESGYLADAYYLTHYLTGFSFRFFGQNELAARLPEIVFGTLVIGVVYLLGRQIYNSHIGLAGAFLTAFSYLQIAWSRQARGYVIFEFFFLISLYFLYRFLTEKRFLLLVSTLVFLILAFLTHTLGLILLPIIFSLIVVNFSFKKLLSGKKLFLFLVAGALICLLPINKQILSYFFNYKISRIISGEHFLGYYHALFWRGYPLLVFLTLLALVNDYTSSRAGNRLIGRFFAVVYFFYLLTLTIFIHVPFEKYALVMFPLLFLTSSAAIYYLSRSIYKRKLLIFYLLIGFIVINGNKFSLKPKSFYSLNFDMKEIPEIDYRGIYQGITLRAESVGWDKLAIVDIDEDIPAWYLGEGGNYYNPRNDREGEEESNSVGAIYIHSLDEFIGLTDQYRYGFLLLVEHNFRFYPEGLVEYARENLVLEKKEEFAWFSPDWNRWPIELYSWGFEIEN